MKLNYWFGLIDLLSMGAGWKREKEVEEKRGSADFTVPTKNQINSLVP